MFPSRYQSENLIDSVHSLDGKNRVRSYIRNRVLDLASMMPVQSDISGFVRCLYLHYVFDDQKAEFERKIAYLSHHAECIDSNKLLQILRGELPVDRKYVHLSFDDGLSCVLRNAAPILLKYQIPATIFINSKVADGSDIKSYRRWMNATNYKQDLSVMNWASLKELSHNYNFTIGAHTKNHVRLTEISNDSSKLEDEIIGCKRDIEKNLGSECRYFAWPYGTLEDIDNRSLGVIQKAGFDASFGVYRAAISTDLTDQYKIPRHHFEPQWPMRHFKYFYNGGMEKKV